MKSNQNSSSDKPTEGEIGCSEQPGSTRRGDLHRGSQRLGKGVMIAIIFSIVTAVLIPSPRLDGSGASTRILFSGLCAVLVWRDCLRNKKINLMLQSGVVIISVGTIVKATVYFYSSQSILIWTDRDHVGRLMLFSLDWCVSLTTYFISFALLILFSRRLHVKPWQWTLLVLELLFVLALPFNIGKGPM